MFTHLASGSGFGLLGQIPALTRDPIFPKLFRDIPPIVIDLIIRKGDRRVAAVVCFGTNTLYE
ncbi:MAG: hypothetical protein CMJ20_00985 [Phycisphaeraceae bacterium]|nr:hypothetical protein [Phycisphaeraceae bacterium]|tara:strand:+ start:1537 stop:1725 length:189 start_codon:yes stop_codon:yes gene_type:complete